MKGYNPGPDFSTYEYWESNRDIKKIRINPLLHYELYGRKEKRKILFSDEKQNQHHAFIANSPYFDGDWYKQNYDIPDDVDCEEHYLKIGYAKRYDPSSEFSTSEYYACNVDVEEHGMNPLLHYENYGRDEGRDIR